MQMQQLSLHWQACMCRCTGLQLVPAACHQQAFSVLQQGLLAINAYA